MRLLLSGFEPFGGESVNPSQEVVRRIAEAPPPGVGIETLVLPVRAGIALEQLVPAFERGEFDAWLGLGQAEGRAGLSVERLGVNLRIDRASDGSELAEETLIEGAAAAEFASVPVRRLVEAIRAAGVPAAASSSAGMYICNEVLFVMAQQLAATGSGALAGFIHLPFLPEQAAAKVAGTPSLALEAQLRGALAAIESLTEAVVTSRTT